MRDLRYAARTLGRSPGLALAIMSLLAVGVGASSVIFSAVDVVLLRSLPVKNPEELVRIVQTVPQVGTISSFPFGVYQALREQTRTLYAVFGEAQLTVAMNDPGPAEVIQVGLVTPEFFETLGVQALYGRSLARDDDRQASGDLPAVLSFGFWQRRFGGDPGVIGKPIVLRGHRFVIAGVMPATFNGIAVETSPAVRLPLSAYDLVQTSDGTPMAKYAQLEIAGRLRPGVTRSTA